MESHDLLRLLVIHAWQVAMLAAVVWALTSWLAKNQPHVAHLLWGLVLIKVITPPVWSSPTSVFGWLGCGFQPRNSALVEQPTLGPPNRSSSAHVVVTLAEPPQTAEVQSATHVQVPDGGAALASPERSRVARWKRLAQGVLVAWIGGVLCLLAIAMIRVARFWRWAQRLERDVQSARPANSQLLEAQLQQLTDTTARRLGMHRPIRVRLLHAPIGPAVVGLMRPTIVLPVGIVEHRTTEFLQPLVAHELVHIQRGDLWWATLQTVSTSLLWFHPFVWLAARKLTYESERSCDEQTIAWLGCAPKAYAQNLIDVLERKYQLHIAPALPGVRPVDVTKRRLERIMQLGQGSRKRTPIWAWTIWAAAGALTLPGSIFVGAQEVRDASNSLAPSTLALAPQTAPSTLIGQTETAEFEVSDVLEKLRSAVAGVNNEEQARAALLAYLRQGIGTRIFNGNHDGVMDPSDNVKIVGTRLQLVGTPEQVAQVRETLEERRRFGFDQLAVKIYFLTVSKKQLEQLDIPWRTGDQSMPAQFDVRQFDDGGLAAHSSTATIDIARPIKPPQDEVFHFADGTTVVQPPSKTPYSHPRQPVLSANTPPVMGPPVQDDRKHPQAANASATPNPVQPVSFQAPQATELKVPANQTPAFFATLAEADFQTILQQALANPRTNVLLAPQVTAFNGTTIQISDTVQRPFVTAIAKMPGQAAIMCVPTIQIAVEGIKVVTQPNVDGDGQIHLLFGLNERCVRQVDTFTYDKAVTENAQGHRVESGTTVQIPHLTSRFFALQSSVQPGEYLMVTSGVPTLEAVGKGRDDVLIAVAKVSPKPNNIAASKGVAVAE